MADTLALYGYYRSSCSARLRIALALKQIRYQTVFVNIKEGSHLQDSYSHVNPCKTVPTLEVRLPKPFAIMQSVAALEYLDEAYPSSVQLLPPVSDLAGRAQVRVMVNIIANDIQPVTNMKVLQRIRSAGENAEEWA